MSLPVSEHTAGIPEPTGRCTRDRTALPCRTRRGTPWPSIKVESVLTVPTCRPLRHRSNRETVRAPSDQRLWLAVPMGRLRLGGRRVFAFAFDGSKLLGSALPIRAWDGVRMGAIAATGSRARPEASTLRTHCIVERARYPPLLRNLPRPVAARSDAHAVPAQEGRTQAVAPWRAIQTP